MAARSPARACSRAWSREAGPPPRLSVMPRSWSLAAVTLPTPQSRSTGSGWRKASSSVGRHHQQPVGLGNAARHFGEELGAGHSDRDGQPDLVENPAPQAASRSPSGFPKSAQATYIEEGLIDRNPFDQRRGVVENLEHRLACLRVGGDPGLDHDRMRAQAPGESPTHGAADPEGPGLVAGRQDHTRTRRSPDDPAGGGCPAARPTRRRRRGRHEGSLPPIASNICSLVRPGLATSRVACSPRAFLPSVIRSLASGLAEKRSHSCGTRTRVTELRPGRPSVTELRPSTHS